MGCFGPGSSNPGDRFSTPNRQTARCDILPTPEGAAFLLIEFDADLKIPSLVVQTVTKPSGEGYEVEMSYFAEIQNKSGKTQRIYIPRRRLDRQIDMIFENSGGQPIPD